jgi:CelD/BcsL family acetyltransferase involved in cellulose biosynthesis
VSDRPTEQRNRRPVRPSAPVAGRLRLAAVGPDTRQAWQEIVDSHPDLAVCHLPEWMDCVCQAGPFADASRLYVAPDGRRLLLPLAKRRHLTGRLSLYESWPPYWEGARDSGGLIGEHGIVMPRDVQDVIADLTALPALRTRVVPSTADAPVWAVAAPSTVPRTAMSAYVVDLTGGFERVWSERFTKKARYKSRKAERDGIVVEMDTTGRLLPEFDALYRRSVDTWSQAYFLPTPLARRVIDGRHPHAKLEVVARRLGGRCQIWIARRNGQPVSGIVVLSHGSAATYWKGATDKALVGASGATDLLHRRAIEEACLAGRTRYDLGVSGLASLTAFKLSIGATRQDYHAYRFERLPLTDVQEGLRTSLKRAAVAVQRYRSRRAHPGGNAPGPGAADPGAAGPGAPDPSAG